MARLSLLPALEDGQSLDAWERGVKMRKRAVQLLGALIFLGVMVLEFQQQFTANPFYLFLLVFAMVLVWVLSDYMTARVERVKADAEWAHIEERDRRTAEEK